MKPAPNRYLAVRPAIQRQAGERSPAGEGAVAAGGVQHQPVGGAVQAAVAGEARFALDGQPLDRPGRHLRGGKENGLVPNRRRAGRKGASRRSG